MSGTSGKKRILIVDDVQENIAVLRQILSDYVRLVALDSVQALTIANADPPPDLILLDILMPDVDGYEVCRRLKVNEKTRDIPIIFLTAKNSVEDEARGLALGAVDYITKPISPPVVLARVMTHLELKRQRDELARQTHDLKEQEAHLRSITATLAEGLYVTDMQWRITFVNPVAMALLGWREEEMLGQNAHTLFHHSHVDGSLYPFSACPMYGVLSGEGIAVSENEWFWRRDGTCFPVSMIASSISRSGEFHGVVVAFRDITDRKRDEDALIRSEAHFRTLFEATSDAVMLLDENGFLDCNGSTLVIFGCASREEFCRLHPSDLSPPVQPQGVDSLTLANQHIAVALANCSNRFEWMHRRMNGRDFPAEVLLNSVALEGRRVLMAVVRDITERKEAEADRVATHLALHEAHIQLKQQYTALQEMDKLRKDVEAITRHDLKSPINGIIGCADLLLEEELSQPDTKRFAKLIRDSAGQLREMVNMSLNLLNMEQGRYEATLQPVSLLPILHRILTDHQTWADRKQIKTIITVDGQPVQDQQVFTVLGDQTLCYTMIANLYKNALEASDLGNTVTIALHNAEMATIAIHNSGAVPKAIRERFFEKYVTHGKKGGTGLGTYSSRLMAGTQQGSIHLHSSEADGTTITVTLRQKWGEQ